MSDTRGADDVLVRGISWGGGLRLFAARTTRLAGELKRRHGTYPTATAALGRAATAGAMMGAMLKGEEKLTVQVKGDGPLGRIVVDANAKGEVRGYVDNPQVDLPPNEQGKLDVAGAVGRSGFLYVVKDLGLKEPYRGSVPIISGELGEDFTYYFASSEQTPSAVGLGVLVDTDGSVRQAGGFILQLMPGVEEQAIERLERRLKEMPQLTSLLDRGETPESILRYLADDDVQILERIPVAFKCNCSRERVERTLVSMGEEELRAMIEEDGRAEVTCHFCNSAYAFDRSQLTRLLEQAKTR
jgi:molecular chaperone Hsp33